jgi:phosphatidylinositol glycan class V
MNTQHGRLFITPAVQLILVFSIWKVGLLLLAALTPGPGYDTSGLILFINDGNRHVQYQSLSVIERLTLKLFRWDALYFVKATQRGYEYEQEWAFSATYSSILRVISNCTFSSLNSATIAKVCLDIFGHDESLKHYIWTGLLVSNLSHLLSVLILYRLLRLVLPAHQNGHIPLIAAVLHVLSPASLFLSAPYAESLFSLLNFFGMLLYVLARQAGETTTWTVRADAYMLSSGLIFAAATLIRSNGLLSGLIFLYDMTCLLPDILAFRLGWHEIRRAFVTCVSGSMIAAGYISPQLVAYQSFCVVGASNSNSRPWCSAVIPSIYSWVQNYYWCVVLYVQVQIV